MSTCAELNAVTFFSQAFAAASTSSAFLNNPLVSDFLNFLSDAVFYCSVRDFVINDIVLGDYTKDISSRLATAIAYLSSVIFTIWIGYQGYLIILAQNKQPILATLQKGAKIVFIMTLVSFLAKGSPLIAENVFAFKDVISYSVVGYKDENETIGLRELIDINLAITSQLAKITDSMASSEHGDDKKNKLTTGAGMLGQSGPAMLTAILMMLAELSITFAIMLSPLFIFFLLFQQTATLFWSWAKFIVGALFSIAVLTVVATLALKATAVYGMSVLVTYYLSSIMPTNSDNLILGGIASILGSVDIAGSFTRLTALGFLMTALIISVPAMVMQFFNAGVGFATGAMNGMMGLGAGGRSGMGTGGTGIPGMRFNGYPQQNLPGQQEVSANERNYSSGVGPVNNFPMQSPPKNRSSHFSGLIGNARSSNDFPDANQYGDGTVLDYRSDYRSAIANLPDSNSSIVNSASGSKADLYSLGSNGESNQPYTAAAIAPATVFSSAEKFPRMTDLHSPYMNLSSQNPAPLEGLKIAPSPSRFLEESRFRDPRNA